MDFGMNKMILAVLFRDKKEAMRWSEMVRSKIHGGLGSLCVSEFYFYRCLCILDSWEFVDKEFQAEVDVLIDQIQMYSIHAPSFFGHKYDLLCAMRDWVIHRDFLQSVENFDLSISKARKQHYQHEEALANELAADSIMRGGRSVSRTTMCRKPTSRIYVGGRTQRWPR